MDYKAGSHIPEKEILRRYKDEDGETFLEVRGIENTFFRVTTGNQVYYKIDKDMLGEEDLVLIDDFSEAAQGYDSEPVIELSEFETSDSFIEMGPEMLVEEEDAPLQLVNPEPQEDEIEITELEEGQIVPRYLRPLCKKTAYGGYSFRYNRFLYMLDKEYRVEMKTADSMTNYMLGVEDKVHVRHTTVPPGEKPAAPAAPVTSFTPVMPVTPVTPVTSVKAPPSFPSPPSPPSPVSRAGQSVEMKEEFKTGEFLPIPLRERCEMDITTGAGRVIIGNYLYLLDANYAVTARMKLAHSAGETTASVPVFGDAPRKQPSAEEIVTHLVKHFEIALAKYNISADFFKDSVLGPGYRETLLRMYNGDLTELSDDTREAAAQGKLTVLESEKGFTLLRAAILHELYIKSTLAGRGNNMKYYVTHICSIGPDGRLSEFQGEIPLKKQQDLLEFFGSRAGVYTDKTKLIKQLYRDLRITIFEDYQTVRKIGGKVSFNAFLIVKLYEHTTRLDRGDGITMIRLSRDIMDYH